VGLGIFPGFGGTQRTTRLVGKGHACELIFTGKHISADEALEIGLVNRVHPPAQLIHEARALAERIAGQGPVAVAQAKTAINQALQTGLDDGLAFELDAVMETFKTDDQKEGMTAFLKKRKPEFKGQ
jgi:enoyl-CoA hydratase